MESYTLAVFTLFTTLYSACALPPNGACLLEMDEGPCRGEIQRYFYNTITQKCEEFYYGGCEGNANNFKSYEACHKSCFRIPKIPRICRHPQEIGPCRSMLPRYSFNMTSMRCELFYYGGCHGNDNRFMDLVTCKEYCSPHKTVPVLCQDPLDKGSCGASIPRYYYNTASRMCEQFMYSGCGGGNNNFVTRQSCVDVCGSAGKRRPVYDKRPRVRSSRRIVYRRV